MEQAGWDFVGLFDQTNGYFPSSLWTEEFTPLAGMLPDLDAYFDTTALISCAARDASTIEFLYGVIDSVRRAPNVIAQTILTLDHATQGRTITVLGSGENKQMKPYGIARKGANDKLWDAAHIIRAFLESNEPVSYQGRVWNLDRALMTLGPYGERRPRVWIAGDSSDVMELAGACADGWVTWIIPGTDEDTEVFRERIAQIRRHSEEVGRDPSDIAICTVVPALIHDDAGVLDELRDNPLVRWISLMAAPAPKFKQWGLGHPYGGDWNYGAKLFPSHLSREEALEICRMVPRESVDLTYFVGAPDEVVKGLEPFLEAGVTHLWLTNFAPLVGADDLSEAFREAVRSARPAPKK